MHADFEGRPELANRLAASSLLLRSKPQGIMAWTLTFLERCRYRAMTSDEDMELLARWRWENFMESETVLNRSLSMKDMDDGMERVSGARTVGLYFDGVAVSSMRIHAINREQYNVGVVGVGRDLVASEVEKGRRFVYASRWISDPKFKATTPLIVATTRISCLAAEYHRADFLLSTSRENHVKTYVRMQDAVVWSKEPEKLEHMNYLYHLIASEYAPFRDRMAENRQAYLSTALERARMFAPDADSRLLFPATAGDVVSGRSASGFAG